MLPVIGGIFEQETIGEVKERTLAF